MSKIAPKILAAHNQHIFSSGRHFYLLPLVVQKVTTPLVSVQNATKRIEVNEANSLKLMTEFCRDTQSQRRPLLSSGK